MLLLLIVIVLVIVVGIKRFKSYEISFKRGIVFGIIVFLAFATDQYIETASTFRIDFPLGIILGGVFIMLISIIVRSVGESFCREIWNEKFISIDLLFKRYLIHSKIGNVIVNSIVFGFGITAIVFLVFKFQSDYFLINLLKVDFLSPEFISAPLPISTAFNSTINSYAIMIIALIFFISESIKRFIKDEIAFIVINSLFFSIFIFFGFTPLYISITLSFVIGLLISIILIKMDLLTTYSLSCSFFFNED